MDSIASGYLFLNIKFYRRLSINFNNAKLKTIHLDLYFNHFLLGYIVIFYFFNVFFFLYPSMAFYKFLEKGLQIS
jgi:hypothetical protein